MPTRDLVQLDANGNVIGQVSVTTDEPLPPVPANTREITARPDRDAIARGDRRWDGTAWVNVARSAPLVQPAIATLTDRQLLERIAIALGVAK